MLCTVLIKCVGVILVFQKSFAELIVSLKECSFFWVEKNSLNFLWSIACQLMYEISHDGILDFVDENDYLD